MVNFSDVRQRIDGFGASDTWIGALSDAQADLFFSTTNGIGLSILRQGIDSSGGSLSTAANATKAAARGAIVWAAPWSAPGAWKDNGSTTNGGHLLPAYYDAWATRLANFATNLKQSTGVPVYAISVQNEPDYVAGYDSMIYTNQEMANFVKVLGPKLAALNPRPKLLMPEVSSWGNAWGFNSTVLGDSTAAQYLDVLAVHQYAGLTAPQSTARPIWETEQSSFEGFDPGILNGVGVARWIHDALVTGGVSAWHYWWLVGLNADNEGLIGYNRNTQITKRLYTVGNFSKFVRPGFYMVGVTGAPANVSVSAFKNPNTGAFAIVAINQNGIDTPVTVMLNGQSSAAVTPWITSTTLDLAQQANLPVTSGTFTTTLPAYSVTSFVSSGTAPPPPNDTTPPSVPAGLGATTMSSSQINLSWTASSDNVGVSGYRIYRGGTPIGTSSSPSYNDSGLAPSTTYTYAVAAFDAAGNASTTSGNASTTTYAQTSGPPAAPNSPTPASGATVGTTPTLTWSSSGATGYYVGLGTTNPPGQVSANQSAASYTPGTLLNNTTYYWQIHAVNANGATAGPMWTFTTGTTAPQPPAAPTGPTPANGATGIGTTPTLTWSASGATSYDVAFGTTSSPSQVSANQASASYAPGALANNTTYFWRITARNANGTTTGAVWSFTTAAAPQPPGAPANPTPANGATAIGTSPTLTWTASGATSYDVAFGTSSSPSQVSSNQTSPSYTPGTLANSTTYFWRITARNANGTTAGATWSFTTAAATSGPPATPNTPTPGSGTSGVNTTPTLTWSASGATSYYVGFGTSNPPGQVSANQSAASYTPGTLLNNTTYYWQIHAVNTSGSTAGPVWSFTTGATQLAPNQPPSAPSAPSPSSSANGVTTTPTLTWSSSGATGYYVGLGTSNPPGLVSANQSASSYTPARLLTNTTYYWQIYAVNSNGSTPGPIWSFTTGASEPTAQVLSRFPTVIIGPSTATNGVPPTK